MSGYKLTTDKRWDEVMADVAEQFQRWGVRDWEVNTALMKSRAYSTGLPAEERAVEVRWRTAAASEMRLRMDKQARPVDNLRVLFLGIEALRLNEVRGLADLMAEAYLQLPAPVRERDPWEVLGLRSDADAESVEAVYRAKARRLHPDAGGDAEAFKELSAAYEKVRAGR